MISQKDYLKNYNEMNEMEKKGYLRRVEKWTSETFPELLALATCWEKVPVKDFDEGCLLVSAIANSRPFLNDVQRYEARVAIKKINLYLEKVRKESGLAKRATRGPVGTESFRAIVPEIPVPDENGEMQPIKEYVEPEVENRRPKDFALYKDKLPKHIQEKGEKWLKDKYLELADYRGRLEMMVETPNITGSACKDMADRILKVEQDIRAFWGGVDAEYNRYLNGGKPEEKESQTNDYLSGMKRPGDFTRAEIEAMADTAQQEMCKKARIDGNKKYINRNDVKITDEYREQLALRIRELMEWGENLPRKTTDVATRAGVFIEGVNKEDKIAAESKVVGDKRKEFSDTEGNISESAEKVSGNPKKSPETSQSPKRKIDPTESVTEGQIKKGGAA